MLPATGDVQNRSYEIAACIKQADEYYRSAETVGLATEPLLQFYGAQALAKATVLSTDPNLWLSNLNYHGLSTRPSIAPMREQDGLRLYSNDPTSWKVESEYAVTHDGVFPELCRSVGDNVPERGEVIRFLDLLRIIPDLAKIFSRHYGEPSHCFYLIREPTITPDVRMEVFFSQHQNENIEEVRQVFPEFDNSFEEIKHEGRYQGFRSYEAITEVPTFCVVDKGTVAGSYLIRPLACGVHKSISVLYASLFILSNLVRYKPAFWMRVIEGEHSGSASMAEALCNVAKRRLPNDALEQIWQEDFIYATPGYLT